MSEIEKLLEGVPPEARAKAAKFIMNRGEETFKRIFSIEQFNFEEALEATASCSEEEFAMVRELIKDSYGLDLRELATGVKQAGAGNVKKALAELRTKKAKDSKFRFSSSDVLQLAKKISN